MVKDKKLIRIEPFVGGDNDPYTSNRIKFALVAKNGGVRRQVVRFSTCRDYINEVLRARVHGKSFSNFYTHNPDGKFIVDMSCLRLLVGKDDLNSGQKKDFRRNIFSAKRLINFYENEGNWNKSSVITTVRFKEDKDRNKRTSAWLLTGPKEWLAYSQLVSMVTLLFRIVSDYGPIEFNNNYDIEKWFYKLILKHQASKASGIYPYNPDILTYLPTCWDKFYMIVTCYDDIFTQPLEEAYPMSGNVHGPGGIFHLCLCATKNKVLDKNMKETYAKYSEAMKEHKKRLMKEAEEEFKKET